MDASEAMQQAIIQASKVEGRTSPRPPVGAVIVQAGRIVGAGATMPPYGPHAEVVALTMAGPLAQGADLYVTLEPCCITVHTPPCTQAIIAAGIRRVFVAQVDANPNVAGRGIEQLRAAGISVHIMQHIAEAERLLRPFATYITTQRPHVTAKWAMTLDGKTASIQGDTRWISSPQSRAWVHDLRDRVDAILIGATTARLDNAQLTVRLTPEQRAASQRTVRPDPWRVIMTTSGILPEYLHVLQPPLAERTIIIVGESCPLEQQQRLRTHGVTVLPVVCDNKGQIDIQAALQALAEREIIHVLLEGGAQLLGSAFERMCIDDVVAFIAPFMLGGQQAPNAIAGRGIAKLQQAWSLDNLQIQQFSNDIMVSGTVNYQAYAQSIHA